MNIIESKCYARAGLLGNPSDGYNGKTISFAIKNYLANVKLTESDALVFQPGSDRCDGYQSLEQFASSAQDHAQDGGERLLKAALSRVLHHFPECMHEGSAGFEVAFESNIPRQVGMAGSSAIVIAAIRAYAKWFEIEIKPEILASIALAAENDIGISAGLQDRVIQAMQGLVFMDFDAAVMRNEGDLKIGNYSAIASEQLTSIYVAYANQMPESTEVLHGDLRKKYQSGDSNVIETLAEIAHLAALGKQALEAGDSSALSELVDRNFDLRQQICILNPGHVKMIQAARACGASAKYCGSGGAIVGTYTDAEMLAKLKTTMADIDCVVFRPEIV